MQSQQNKHEIVNCDMLEDELCSFAQYFVHLVLQLVFPQCVDEMHYYEKILHGCDFIILFPS